MKLQLVRQGKWYWTDKLSVGGQTSPGWIHPAVIALEKVNPLEKRRLVISYVYAHSNSKTPPVIDAKSRRLIHNGDDRFVSYVGEDVSSMSTLLQYMEAQMRNIFTNSDLILTNTVSELENSMRKAVNTAQLYPVEYQGSPTGYLGVWSVSHREEYQFTDQGLEAVACGANFRCGWVNLRDNPDSLYLFPEGKFYYASLQYRTWPEMIAELQHAAVDQDFVYEAESYRRAFQ